jgi:hypothetical protein
MDVKTAIRTGDADAQRRLLARDPTQANALIYWGNNDCVRTHPLHYVSDRLFNDVLQKCKELPLVEALLEAGTAVDFRKAEKRETPLIGAASLGAEDVGPRLLDAGATRRSCAEISGRPRFIGPLCSARTDWQVG